MPHFYKPEWHACQHRLHIGSRTALTFAEKRYRFACFNHGANLWTHAEFGQYDGVIKHWVARMDNTVAGLIGAGIAGVVALVLERIRWKNEKAKLLAAMLSKPELQAARLQAYKDLWRCLGGISTRNPTEITSNLRSVQDRLHAWYYGEGGGLLLEGRADAAGSTKELFFVARDLSSTDPAEIWRAFHELRRAVRHDIGVYEDSDAEERARMKAEALFNK